MAARKRTRSSRPTTARHLGNSGDLTITAIQQRRSRADLMHDTAAQIRELLDKARMQYGAEDYDDDEIESDILELVTAD